MLTNGNSPVLKSAAQQRYAERKAQPAQQGYNAAMMQQGEQQLEQDNFKSVLELLKYEAKDYLLNTTDPRLEDIRKLLSEPGAEVDSSYILHRVVAEYVSMAIVRISMLGGEELRKQRDSLDVLVKSHLLGPIFEDILGHLETVTTTTSKGGVSLWQQDPYKMQVALVTTTLKEVNKAIALNGGIPVLAEKPEYSLKAGNRVGFTLEDRGYIWVPEKIHEILGNTPSQLYKGGNFSSAIKSQQETVMPTDTLDTARKVRFFTIKHKVHSFFGGMYDILESGFLDKLSWDVVYLSDPFPGDSVDAVYKFDKMLENHAEDFSAVCNGGNVSSSFMEKFGNMEVHAYVFRRAVNNSTGADKALSLPREVYKMDEDEAEPVEAKAEVKAEPEVKAEVKAETEVKTEPEAKPAAKKPAARKATKKTTSSKAKAKAEDESTQS